MAFPPDLNLVVESWRNLPDALKQGIVAMVKAAAGKEQHL